MTVSSTLTSDGLHAFGVFARHLNFTHAASELHLSQPSLHAKINKLGRSLGVELYVRRGRELSLTEQGEALANFAIHADHSAESFLRDLQALPPKVSLFAGRAMLRWLLDERITVAVRSGVEVDVTEADREVSMAALVNGSADVIGIAADAPPADLERVSLGNVEQLLLVKRSHKLAKNKMVCVRDLDGLPLVLPSVGRPHRTRVEAAFAQTGGAPTVVAEVDGWEMMAHMASLGLGAAIINGVIPAPKGMATVPISDLPAIEYWLAWRPERRSIAQHLGALDGP